MSALRTAPVLDPTPDRQPTRGRRRLRFMLVTLAALVAVAIGLPVAVDASASALGAHGHGTLDIRIDGETVDLDQPRFHDRDPEFHVHAGHGNLWHHHPENLAGIVGFERMTLAEALAAIGVELDDDRIAFDGAVHRLDAPDAGVTVRLGGVEVDPAAHVIGDGDAVTVEVVTGR